MREPVVVPALGESVSKGTIIAWLKQNGDAVREGDGLFELETDKATVTVPAVAAGELTIAAPAGREVTVGEQVAVIERADVAAAPVAEARAPAVPAPAPPVEAAVAAGAILPPPNGPEPRREFVAAPTPASPPAREPAAPAPAVPPAHAAGGSAGSGQTRTPMTTLRRRTAARLLEARRETVYVTTFNEIDLQRVLEIRARCRKAFERAHGVKLGFMSFFIKACVKALQAYPVVNAFVEGDDIVYNSAYHIGVAVSVERGLVVPVIRQAEARTFVELERAVAVLSQRARDKQLTPDELAGGTFSITNGGVFGSLLSTPVPAYPQSAILGMHAIKDRPVVVGGAIVVRPMMFVALTYDHRSIDGREAIGFLVLVRELLEDPDRLLLEL